MFRRSELVAESRTSVQNVMVTAFNSTIPLFMYIQKFKLTAFLVFADSLF